MNSNEPVWIDRYGNPLLLEDINDNYLKNIVGVLRQRIQKGKEAKELIKVFKTEAQNRDIKLKR